MQTADANRFRDLLRGMGRVFGNEPDAVILDAYWLALQSWELDEFEQACGHLLANSKFMPRPADFTALRKAARKTSGEAWIEVLDYVRGGGYRQWDCGMPTFNADHPQIQDPLIQRAVRAIGGFQAVANSKTEATHFLEKRFAEHYEAIGDAEEIRESVPQLAGPSRLSLEDQRMIQGMLERHEH